KAIISLYKTDFNNPPLLNFKDLDSYCNQYALDFKRQGIQKGTKTIVMIKPGIDFIAVTFALFKLGAVPVLIDPGMGTKNMVLCIAEVEPEAFIGIPLAHLFKAMYRKPFKTIKTSITIKGFNKQPTISRESHFKEEETTEDEMAAILFTSGSTGVPKGVVYTHAIFREQVKVIQETYMIEAGEIDLAAFPLFALFGFAMGMTVIIPDMDPSKPAQVEPEKFVNALMKFNVTGSFGSPAIWRRVVPYCNDKKIKLNSIKRVLIAGAPVPGELLKKFREILPETSETYTPYGCTEALPVSSISGNEVCRETLEKTKKGEGICVGFPLKGVEIKIIKIVDKAIETIKEVEFLEQGTIGEIMVKGGVVTPRYYNRDASTQLAKIKEGDTVWHRIGDVGYFDSKKRLWFVGRKNHRVEISPEITLFSIQVEALFNNHPDVFRSALVGVGAIPNQTPVMIIEPVKKGFMSAKEKKKIVKELRILLNSSSRNFEIKHILFYSSFPVDVRHNAKINREQLAIWAEKKVG
ncbi:MAG: AMP-binding protein, partial [Nitrospinae bacterium]|nr:AMP-binding protein [Nitrospinota bacterium]